MGMKVYIVTETRNDYDSDPTILKVFSHMKKAVDFCYECNRLDSERYGPLYRAYYYEWEEQEVLE